MILRLIAVIAVFTFFCPLQGISADEPATLATFRGILDKSFKKYAAECDSSLTKWNSNYNKTLLALQKKAQSSGELDDLLVIKKEKDRVARSKTLEKKDIVSSPVSLKGVQEQYQELYVGVAIKKNQQIMDLVEKYVDKLKYEQTKATRGGKIEDALAYRAEVERAESCEELTKAKLEMDALDVDRGVDKSGSSAGAADVEAKKDPESEPAEVPKEVIELENECKIYPPGVSLPKTGIVYKRTSLSDTRLGSPKKKVSCIAQIREDKTGIDKSRGYYGSSYKSGSSLNHVRLQIRTASSSINEGFDVYVEFYSKPVSTSGNVDPSLIEVQHIPISGLNSKFWYVDCSPVSLSISSYRSKYGYRSSYYSSSSYTGSRSNSGGEFYGIIVSAYDAEGELTYQGCSTPKLISKATAEKP